MTGSSRLPLSIAAMVLAVAGSGCGGNSSPAAAGASADTATATSSPATAAATSGWPADACSVVDAATVSTTIGAPILAASTPPGLQRVCEYTGARPPSTEPVVLTRVTFYPDRSEWDIHLGNSGVQDADRVAGLGREAFKSSEGIWVLLGDDRMFIADVVYGADGESAKELALTKAVVAAAAA